MGTHIGNRERAREGAKAEHADLEEERAAAAAGGSERLTESRRRPRYKSSRLDGGAALACHIHTPRRRQEANESFLTRCGMRESKQRG